MASMLCMIAEATFALQAAAAVCGTEGSLTGGHEEHHWRGAGPSAVVTGARAALFGDDYGDMSQCAATGTFRKFSATRIHCIQLKKTLSLQGLKEFELDACM